jgi:Fe-S-cluster containining protein
MAASLPELSHLDRGDGGCVHLTADDTCAIYEARPDACRVGERVPPWMTVNAWYRANEAACEALRVHLRVLDNRRQEMR